jgi:hypothetical protein
VMARNSCAHWATGSPEPDRFSPTLDVSGRHDIALARL